MLLAARIDDAMRMKGWNEQQLMEELGIMSPSEISQWLSGMYNFTIDTLSELEVVLGVQFYNLNVTLGKV